MGSYKYEVSDFQRVYVEHAISVDIVKGEAYSVTIEAEDISHVKVEKAGDALIIGRRGFGWTAFLHPRPQVSITMPELRELRISGASRVRARGLATAGELLLKLSGASQLEINSITAGGVAIDISGASNITGDIATSGAARFDISGASRVELSGTGSSAAINLSEASTARLSNLSFNSVSAGVSGASSAYLKITSNLEIDLSGASRLEYTGTPVLGKVKVTGASTLKQR